MFNPNPLTISSHTNYIFVLNFIEKLNIMHCIHKWVIFYTIVCQLVITLCVKGLIFWPWKNLDQLSPLLKMHIELELGCVGTIEASGVASVFIVCRGHTPTTLFLFFLTLIYLRHISFRSSRALLGVFMGKRLQIWEFFPYRKKIMTFLLLLYISTNALIQGMWEVIETFKVHFGKESLLPKFVSRNKEFWLLENAMA